MHVHQSRTFGSENPGKGKDGRNLLLDFFEFAAIAKGFHVGDVKVLFQFRTVISGGNGSDAAPHIFFLNDHTDGCRVVFLHLYSSGSCPLLLPVFAFSCLFLLSILCGTFLTLAGISTIINL